MTQSDAEVPRAQVANAPLHKRSGFRKLVVVAVLAVAGFVGWKLLKNALRSDENKRMEYRQDMARSRIGHGLDRLFERQLDEDSKQVQLVAKLHLSPELVGTYPADYCAKGFNQAFEDVLGADVVRVSTSWLDDDSDRRLELEGTISPTGNVFKLPHSEASYPGIKLAADMKLVGKTVHADVEPPADIKFEYTRYSTFSTEGASENEINGGILQNTCKQAGYVLLEKLTTWKRPAPPAPSDPVKDCERGFNCRDSADELAPSDPKTAAQLYGEACDHKDADACTNLTGLVLLAPERVDVGKASFVLEMACTQEIAVACAGAAQLALIPSEPGKDASDFQKREALVFALRACDLDDKGGCALAVPLVKKTPFAEAAPLLTGATSVATKRMGTLVGFHWGQWTKMDQGQPTLWVTKRPQVPEGAIVREFARADLPRGITPPDGVETVYAVAFDGGDGSQYDSACEHCKPSGGGGSVYSMRNMDCVCIVTPP